MIIDLPGDPVVLYTRKVDLGQWLNEGVWTPTVADSVADQTRSRAGRTISGACCIVAVPLTELSNGIPEYTGTGDSWDGIHLDPILKTSQKVTEDILVDLPVPDAVITIICSMEFKEFVHNVAILILRLGFFDLVRNVGQKLVCFYLSKPVLAIQVDMSGIRVDNLLSVWACLFEFNCVNWRVVIVSSHMKCCCMGKYERKPPSMPPSLRAIQYPIKSEKI